MYQQAFVAPVGDSIVYEAPLLTLRNRTHDGIVTAVMQSVSKDGGKTWSDPVISTTALIYELGKSTLAPSFLGKAVPKGKRDK